MGYTHYWQRPQTIDEDAWRPLYRDLLAVLQALPDSYPGPYATGAPVAIRGGAGGDRPSDPDEIEGWDGDPRRPATGRR